MKKKKKMKNYSCKAWLVDCRTPGYELELANITVQAAGEDAAIDETVAYHELERVRNGRVYSPSVRYTVRVMEVNKNES